MNDATTGLSLAGQAYLANSSKRVSARLETRDHQGAIHVDLVDDTAVIIAGAPLEAVAVDPPLGSGPRKMTLPDGTVFETEDRAGVEQLIGQTRGDVLHFYEQFNTNLVWIVGLLVASIYMFYRYGLDILVTAAIWLTPPALVDQIDRGTLTTLDVTMASPSELEEDDRERIQKIFANMRESLSDEEKEHDFNLLFRSMPRVGPNAFALPGGTVVITDQFVDRFPQEDVLAAVIGHEMGHVVEQHGLRQTYRSLSIAVLVAFLAGDVGPFAEEIVLEGNVILSLSFSRAHETAADEFGLRLSHEAGFDPSALAIFFREMGKDFSNRGGEPVEWLSTHPSSAARIEAIEAFVDKL